MRKLIIATVALAFVSSTAFAQDKAGDKSGTAPAATSSDTMEPADFAGGISVFSMKMGFRLMPRRPIRRRSAARGFSESFLSGSSVSSPQPEPVRPPPVAV